MLAPPTDAPSQVTREVAAECLQLLSGQAGGLLGAGHSWVAGPGEPADARTAQSPAPAAAAAGQRPAGVAQWLAQLTSGAIEDLQDALAQRSNAGSSSTLLAAAPLPLYALLTVTALIAAAIACLVPR